MTANSLIAFFSFLMSVYFASAQVTGLGPCPVVKPVENFDVTRYIGLWYEFQRYPNFFSAGKCITAIYQLLGNGNVSVLNQQVVAGVPGKIEGYASLVSSGVLSVSFPTIPFNKPSPYIVLDTDYRNYAVVYSCSSSPPRIIDGQYVWLLSRDKKPSKKVIDAARAALTRNGISLEFLQVTEQSGCPKIKCPKV